MDHMDEPQQGPTSQVIPQNSSELHLEERCNRLLRTLAQVRPRFRVSCTLCDNMTPSDHRTTHLVHFLRHHTIESDDKDQLFAFVGISDSDTYNRSWQQGRNKIAKRKAAMVKEIIRQKHHSTLKGDGETENVQLATAISAPVSEGETVTVTSHHPSPGEPSDHRNSPSITNTQTHSSLADQLTDASNLNKVQITSEALNLTLTHSSPSSSSYSSNDNSSTLNHNISNCHRELILNGSPNVVEGSTQITTQAPESSESSTINPPSVCPLKNENSFLRRLLCSERTESPAILTSALNLLPTPNISTPQVSQKVTIKRKRGRPRKYFTTSEMVSTSEADSGVGPVVRRKRGRPRKYPPGYTRPSQSSKNSNMALMYSGEGCRRRGRPPKNANVGKNGAHSQSSQEPCIQTRFMTEKTRELFLKQCQVSFHSDRSDRQHRLEEKKRRLNILVSMEQKLHSQLASELESDIKSDSETSYSSSDEDILSESNSSLTMKKLKSSSKSSTESSLNPLHLVPTTLPGIFFTNPSISIEILPPKKTSGRSNRRHT